MEPNWLRLILLLIPVWLISLAFATYSLIDLSRRKRVKGPRGLWAAILIITAFGIPSGFIASGLYLAWGRHAEEADDLD